MKPQNHRVRWSVDDTALIIDNPNKLSYTQLAKQIGRTKASVMAHKYSILKAVGEISPIIKHPKKWVGSKRIEHTGHIKIIHITASTIEIEFT